MSPQKLLRTLWAHPITDQQAMSEHFEEDKS